MKKMYDKISFSSRFVNFVLNLINYKEKFISIENTKKNIKRISSMEYNLPKKMGFTLEKFNGMDVYSYNGRINDNKKKLLYIHGGAYIENAIYFQLKSVMKIAEKSNSTLIFPVYPLAPKNNYKVTYELIEKLYKDLLKNNTVINMIGDSAGGGFILSFNMYLRDNNIIQPKNIIMLSPWIDISLSNPKMKDYEKKDFILGIKGGRYAGELWKAELESDNFMVSPLYGNFENLSKMTIIVGGNEILKPDIDILKEKLDILNVEYNYFEFCKQCHNFAIYPTKEAKIVMNNIVNIIGKN